MKTKCTSLKRVRAVLLTALVCATLTAGQTFAQAPAPSHNDPVLQAPVTAAHSIEVRVGESRTLDSPWPVKKVSVADPEIADVDAASPTAGGVRGAARFRWRAPRRAIQSAPLS